jgi:hypothetical protein
METEQPMRRHSPPHNDTCLGPIGGDLKILASTEDWREVIQMSVLDLQGMDSDWGNQNGLAISFVSVGCPGGISFLSIAC